MVQEFEWSSYPQGNKLDFTAKLEFTVVMKESLRATIKTRTYLFGYGFYEETDHLSHFLSQDQSECYNMNKIKN
ncbi:hypothetical protein Lal_00021595 [Lupinus albus]|nr:hypothetical protein Lal_00021595 [Lupinus albus]